MVNKGQNNRAKPQVAKASGPTVEQAIQRALAELDFAPGELTEDQYEVTVLIPPEEGFMGVGAVDAVVEVALVGDADDFFGPEDESGAEDGLAEYDEYEEDEAVLAPAVNLEDSPAVARLRNFLARVLRDLGVEARITITESPNELHAEVSGDDLGIFIGRRGQTIDAVEYLAGIAVFTGTEERVRKHVDLDAEGYKERRRRQVERVAIRKAQEASRRGKPVQLAPMTSAERKIVHITLRGRADVTTASQGREPNRSVVITPLR